jgi:hypothetical protein
MGQTRRFDTTPAASGLPRSTDIVRPPRHVGSVPLADICIEQPVVSQFEFCLITAIVMAISIPVPHTSAIQ